MRNPVCWFEIYVQDMERAAAFYEGLLGVKLTPMNSEHLEMRVFSLEGPDAAGATGALARMEGIASGGNSTLVYFATDDCAVTAGRAAALGGKVMRDKFSIGEHGYIAILQDTEGNTIGLHSM